LNGGFPFAASFWSGITCPGKEKGAVTAIKNINIFKELDFLRKEEKIFTIYFIKNAFLIAKPYSLLNIFSNFSAAILANCGFTKLISQELIFKIKTHYN
jgi:hypothetical protein